MRKRLLIILQFLFLIVFQKSNAAINPGDLAVIGWNSDPAVSTKDFAVVALATIASGETIHFTDKGINGGTWQADLPTEGAFSLVTTSVINAGTVIRFSVTSGTTASVSMSPSLGTTTVTNGWTSTSTASPFGNNGDQIIIYQGTVASPTFIYGFNSGISTLGLTDGWHTGGGVANNYSEIPSGLTNGANAVSFAGAGALDNYVYTGARLGTRAGLLASISNASNWSSNDATNYDLSPGGTEFPGANPIFTITDLLPVTLVSFNGSVHNNQHRLVWTIAQAENFSHFVIEKSVDGANFYQQSIINYETQQTTYTSLEQGIRDNNVYYRLKLVDQDGSFTYSKVIRIGTYGEPKAVSIVNIIPNPLDRECRVSVYSPEDQELQLLITDVAGTTVFKKPVQARSGLNNFTVELLQNLKGGLYLVHLIGKKERSTFKILKR